MDHFYEELIVNPHQRMTKLWQVAALILGIVTGLLAVAFLINWMSAVQANQSAWLPLLFGFNMAVLAVGSFVIRSQIAFDFEYALDDETLRIIRIVNGSRRRVMGEYALNNLRWVAPVKDEAVQEALSQKKVKRVYASFARGANQCCLYFMVGRTPVLVVMQPTEALLSRLNRQCPEAFKRGATLA